MVTIEGSPSLGPHFTKTCTNVHRGYICMVNLPCMIVVLLNMFGFPDRLPFKPEAV